MITQPQGITPIVSQNPVLDELDNLSPAAKQAATDAHSHLIGQAQQQIQAPQMGGGVPGLQATPEATQAASPALPQMAAPRQHVPTLGPAPMDAAPYMAEHKRLTDPTLESSKSRIDQIHNPWARVPLQIADAIGSTFAPRLMQALPGTQFHHNMLVGQQADAIDQAETEANDQQKRGLEAAQTENQEAQPEINQLKAENAATKTQLADTLGHDRLNETARNNDLKNNTGLAGKGMKLDESGTIVDDPNSEIGKRNIAQSEYFDARRQLTQAQAEYEKTKNDPNSQANQKWRAQIATQQQRIAQAETSLGMRREALDFQEDKQYNPQPTTATRGAGEQGGIIKDAGQKLIDSINNNPTLRAKLGNLGSYWKQYTNGTPISDPDVAKFMADYTSFAMLQPRLHGFRNNAAVKESEKIIGGVPNNPDSTIKAIQGLMGTADVVERHGTAHGRPASLGGSTQQPNGGGSDMINVQIPGQAPGQIHSSQKAAFLKQFPNAKVL